MAKINYELEKELLIYETLKKSIKELKEYYKNNPDSRIINEKSTIPYLKEQIDCLKNINRFKMSILNHFLYYIKRISNSLELHRLDGTLKMQIRISLYLLSFGIIASTNSSSYKEELLTAEEQHAIINDLSNTIKDITTEFDEKYREEKRIKKESEEQTKKLLKEINKSIEEVKINENENYLKEYSNYFNLDSEKVIEIAKTLTNNFENDVIISIGNKKVTSSNSETMAMFLVWDLYKNSSDYGLTKEELTTSDEISHLKYDEEGKIILRNGLTFSEFMGKVSDSIESDRCFNLAVSNFESDEQTNSQSIEKNNFGGWRYTEEEYLTNISPEAGVIQHCMNIEKLRLRKHDNLSEFSGIYTLNDKKSPNPEWVSNVTSNINLIASNEEKYFILEEEIEKDSSEIILAMSLSE